MTAQRCTVAALCLLAAPGVLATGNAVRGPATAVGGMESVINASGVIELNAARDPVTATPGFESITSIRVDATLGVMGGYAEFDMDADHIVPLGTAVGSSATGLLSFDASVDAPEPGTLYDLIIEMPFDGRFSAIDGRPTLALTGNLSVTAFSVLPFAGTIYQSQLIFELSAANETYDVLPIFDGVQSPLGGGPSTPFTGATADIRGASADRLDAILRLTIPVEDGTSLLISSFVSGIAAPEPGDEFSDTELEVLASAGVVDFTETASLRIIVPRGVTLVGTDPLLGHIVVPAPVPVPAAGWLFGAALASVSMLRGWRRQAS